MDDINNTTSSSDQRLLLDQQFKLVVELVDKVHKVHQGYFWNKV